MRKHVDVNNYTRPVHTSGVQVTYICDMTNTQLMLKDELVDAAMLYKDAPECAKTYILNQHLRRVHVRCIHRGMTPEQAKHTLYQILND